MRASTIRPIYFSLPLLLIGAACERQPQEESPPAAAEQAAALTPEQQMQNTLSRLLESQAAHFDQHGRYADSISVLIDEHGFAPVGDTHAAINFAGTEPRWGYVATATHPFSDQRCEVHHGRASDGREFAGQIVCAERAGAAAPTVPADTPAAAIDAEPQGEDTLP